MTTHFSIKRSCSYCSARADKCLKTSPVCIVTLPDRLQSASVKFSGSPFTPTRQLFQLIEKV